MHPNGVDEPRKKINHVKMNELRTIKKATPPSQSRTHRNTVEGAFEKTVHHLPSFL
jgi:hypothetical protein